LGQREHFVTSPFNTSRKKTKNFTSGYDKRLSAGFLSIVAGVQPVLMIGLPHWWMRGWCSVDPAVCMGMADGPPSPYALKFVFPACHCVIY
jgi:hypothetical protein